MKAVTSLPEVPTVVRVHQQREAHVHGNSEAIIQEPLAYGIGDAATALGVGKSTIYELIKQGRLRAVKIGRRSIIPASSLRALAEVGAA